MTSPTRQVSDVSAVLTGCRGRAERAERALELLLRASGGSSGFLYLLDHDGELELCAPQGGEEPTRARIAALAEAIRQLDERSLPSEEPATGEGAAAPEAEPETVPPAGWAGATPESLTLVLSMRLSQQLRPRLEARLRDLGIETATLRTSQAAQRGFELHQPISLPGVLLVGEAAGVDCVTGEGIPQALGYGALAGSYLAECFRSDDLGFGDWLERVRASDFGRRLRMLHSSSRIFYGPRRAQMESIIAGAPSVLKLWVQGFAGRPRVSLGARRLLAETAPLLARHGGLLLRALTALVLPD